MNIQQLKYFTTVAHLENVSKAAEYLHVSQSALSKQILRLEAELGVELFDRNGKKITLNKAGMRFYDSSSAVLKELKSAEEDITLLTSRQDHRIRIGAAGMPESFPECLGDFAELHPGTEFILNSRIEFEEHTDINEYDALICPDDFKYEKLSGYPLYEETWYFAVNSKNSYAKEKVFSKQMLSGQKAVFIYGGDFAAEFPYRVCSAIGALPKDIYYTDTREAHRRLIAAGKACGFVPRAASESYQKNENIKLLHIMDERFSRPMKICFLREKHLSNIGIAFREFIIRYFELDS